MIEKIANLKGQIDCPYCFSLLQWDSVTDVHVSGGNKYVICPVCNQYLTLDPKRDYWITESSDSGGEGGPAVVGTAVVGKDQVGS